MRFQLWAIEMILSGFNVALSLRLYMILSLAWFLKSSSRPIECMKGSERRVSAVEWIDVETILFQLERMSRAFFRTFSFHLFIKFFSWFSYAHIAASSSLKRGKNAQMCFENACFWTRSVNVYELKNQIFSQSVVLYFRRCFCVTPKRTASNQWDEEKSL